MPDGITFFEGSVTNKDLVHAASKNVEAIIHLAARGSVPRSLLNPVMTQKVNVEGTLNVLEVAREKKLQVIFSSSSSVYGGNTILPKHEELVLKPLTPYAASKLAGEALMMAYGKSYGLCVTNFRFFNVFGPWQRPDHIYSAVIPKWIWQAMNNETLQVYGDGEQSRDFTSVMFVQEVILKSLKERVDHPEPINLALGQKITLNQVLMELRKYFPNLEVQYSDVRSGDVYASQNCPDLLHRIFPNIAVETFQDTLGKTVQWLREEGKKIIGGPGIND